MGNGGHNGWAAVSTRLALAALAGWLPAVRAEAGWIEDRPDRTVIHVKVFDLPDPTNPDTANRAEVAALQVFREAFPARFAAQYRARCEAEPQRYGRHRWDRVEIELEKFTGITVEGVEVDLLAIAGGMAPDVLYLNFRKSDNYIQNGFLHPLDRPEDGYLAALTPEEVAERIHPKLWPVIRRKGPGGATHVWALPYGGALGRVLLYRKDLFDRHGLAYPNAEWTWDDFLAAARRLTDPRADTYGFLMARGRHESARWCTFLWSAGGEVMTWEAATDQWTCVFDSEEAAAAADFYVRLSAEKWTDAAGKVRRGYTSKGVEHVGGKWERGQIGMLIDYMDERMLGSINPDVTGMAPVPRAPGGGRGAELNSRMLGLFAGIREPAVRDAAWEFMRFRDSEEALRVRTRVMVEGGLGPFVQPRQLRRFGYPEIERLAPKGWAEVFEIAVATGHPEPYGRNSNLAYELMTLPLQRAEQLLLRDALPADPVERQAVLRGFLREACAEANEEMMGRVPARERRMRRAVAALVLAGLVAAFGWVFVRLPWTLGAGVAAGGEGGWAWRRCRWAYVLLVPAVLTIVLWRYVPLLRGSVMAFQHYRLLGPSAWAGLDNFGDVLYSAAWWQAVWNSLRYCCLVMGLTFLPPIILAVLLQEVPRGKWLFRTLYYLPAVTTGIVTLLLWKQFYEPSEHGALNALVLRIPAAGFLAVGALLLGVFLLFARRLRLHGLTATAWLVAGAGALVALTAWKLAAPILLPRGEPLAASLSLLGARLLSHTPEPYLWLHRPETAMLACVLPLAWAGMGPGCLIYLAALKTIPEEFYEAADLDGATFVDKILFVVFPSLKALLIINFVGAFIGAWYGATANILAMTGGAANTEVAGLHIWYKAFTFLRFGPATAMAWLLGFMLLGFTVQQLRLLWRMDFRAEGGAPDAAGGR